FSCLEYSTVNSASLSTDSAPFREAYPFLLSLRLETCCFVSAYPAFLFHLEKDKRLVARNPSIGSTVIVLLNLVKCSSASPLLSCKLETGFSYSNLVSS